MIEEIKVEKDLIKLKFAQTPKVSTITNDKFSLSIASSTPVPVSGPFKEIVLKDHYKSIARVLYLFFANPLQSNTAYVLTVSGVTDVVGRQLPPFTQSFHTGTIAPPDPDPDQDGDESIPVEDITSPEFTPPVVAPIEIEDHSIIKGAFLSAETITQGNPDFYIVSTEPENNAVFVEDDFERGRITVTFSERPAPQYLNSQYIRVQRKKLGGVNRWEKLPIKISMDSYHPTVYIYVPSLDATPVYNTADATYFEDGYKYRVKISKEVGV